MLPASAAGASSSNVDPELNFEVATHLLHGVLAIPEPKANEAAGGNAAAAAKALRLLGVMRLKEVEKKLAEAKHESEQAELRQLWKDAGTTAPEPDWNDPRNKQALHRMRESALVAMKKAKTKHDQKMLERFYSEAALRARIRLRYDPEVIVMLDKIWEATDTDLSGLIERSEYLVMHRKLVLALDPSVTPKDAFAAAEEGHRPAYHHRWSAYATNLFDGSDIEH